MDLTKRYENELHIKGYVADDAQRYAIASLQALGESLILSERNQSVLSRLFGKKESPKGVYFWGGVGRGKTFIMDLFYDEVTIVAKKRLHFHRFMKMIHDGLAEMSQVKNPIDKLIKQFSSDTRLLCLDEFFVSDIGDAMILSNILDACYREGIVIVTTSNIFPDGLYENGLQRARFLPAIQGIKDNFNVLELDGGSDYRLRALQSSPLYFSPIDQDAVAGMESMFYKLVPDIAELEPLNCIEVLGRNIHCLRVCEDVLWVTFDQLCQGARSVNDYIEIARLYHAVLISNVPAMDSGNDDAARRFVNMVDEFYDRGVKLVITADVDIYHLYSGTRLKFEFERTESRLLEMQSDTYLARAHKPE